MISVVIKDEEAVQFSGLTNQTFKDFEVIASKDLNKAVRDARGQYLLFWDPGARAEDTFLEKLVSTAERDNSDMSACNTEYVFKEKAPPTIYQSAANISYTPFKSIKDGVFDMREIYADFLENEPTAFFVNGGKLLKKELLFRFLETAQFRTGKNFELFFAMPDILLKAGTISIITKSLYKIEMASNGFGERLSSVCHIRDLYDAYINKIRSSYKNGFEKLSYQKQRRMLETLSTLWTPAAMKQGLGGDADLQTELAQKRKWYSAQNWIIENGETSLMMEEDK
ncbi:MAG: glycosyltransferase [Spirochaetaceae bacterium]|jgi:hypothetical protein|nr:glycosyltransferase [Spirochaetaceae bacterium]